MSLIRQVDVWLLGLRGAFSRQRAFEWFVIVCWAFILREDAAGVTSIIRCFGLAPVEYYNLLHFFHSSAFQVADLCAQWAALVRRQKLSVHIAGRPVYAVDGVKVARAGQRMPAVKSLYQESESNTKPEFIMGHFWGAVSALTTNGNAVFATPLRFEIQDGLKKSRTDTTSLIDQMAELAATVIDKRSLLVGDAYYSTTSMIRNLAQKSITYIGRMKSSTAAYFPPEISSGPRKRGRPRMYGERVSLQTLFEDIDTLTVTDDLALYGTKERLRYRHFDLLWHKMPRRFVLTLRADGTKAIFGSRDASLSPEDILLAYALRYKIETSFKALVHTIGAFAYHFWVRILPKIKRGSGTQFLDETSEAVQKAIHRKIKAYENFVNIAAIATGIMQLLALPDPNAILRRFPVWFRTHAKHGCPTENVTRITLRHVYAEFFQQAHQCTLLPKMIEQRQPRGQNPRMFNRAGRGSPE